MIYNDLAIFTTVARLLSFSSAADMIGIPPSRVSRRIADLEEYLGVKLFERTTRQVRLTEEGRKLMDRCQEPIESLQKISGFADDTKVHTIRITAPFATAKTSIGSQLLDFASHNPDVKLEMTSTNTTLDFFKENIDIAFRVGPLKESNLVARKLWTINYCFCAGDGFIKKYGIENPISREVLVTLPAIVSGQPWQLTTNEQIKPSIVRHEFDTVDMLVESAKRNNGVVLLPQEMITEGLSQLIVKDAVPVSRDMFAVYPKHRLLPARVRRLIDFMTIQDLM